MSRFRYPIALLALLALLASSTGCVLDAADPAPGGQAQGLRLLVGDGTSTTLSHPGANDWAPRIVTLVDGNAMTTRYLLFLTDRYSTPGAPACTLMRATCVTDGVFSNLVPLLGTNVAIHSFYVPDRSSETTPTVYARLVDGTIGEFNNYGTWSFYQFSGNTADGVTGIASGGGDAPFLLKDVAGLGKTLVQCGVDGSFIEFGPYLPLDAMLGRAGMAGAMITSASPAEVPYGGDQVFGAVCTVGGQVVLAVNLNTRTARGSAHGAWSSGQGPAAAPDPRTVPDDPYFAADRVVPLSGYAHRPGVVERDPSWDPASGLYFAADRDGTLDIYWVPAALIGVPDRYK